MTFCSPFLVLITVFFRGAKSLSGLALDRETVLMDDCNAFSRVCLVHNCSFSVRL